MKAIISNNFNAGQRPGLVGRASKPGERREPYSGFVGERGTGNGERE